MVQCSQTEARQYVRELRKCRRSPAYFLNTYASIYDASACGWVPFRLWPAQTDTLDIIDGHRLRSPGGR